MKRDSAAGLPKDPPALAAFKAMDKDSNSLPFPPSVLLTKPLGASEPDLPMQSSLGGDHSQSNTVSLPSITEFIDSYVKPHIAQPFAPPSTPRASSRVPVTPTHSSAPPSPSPLRTPTSLSQPYGAGSHLMRPGEEDHHSSYSPREHLPLVKHHQSPQSQQGGYHQQYMQYQHIREQQMLGQQVFEQREMQYREQQMMEQQQQQMMDQQFREQHLREQQLELQEQLREQQQRLMHPYHYEQYVEHVQRRGSLSSEQYGQMKREMPTEYQYTEHKLTVREQLKLNLKQREPINIGDVHERGGSWNSRSAPLKGSAPTSPLTSPTSAKSASGFTQHMFVVPTSPMASAPSPSPPSSYVPSTPKSFQAPSTPTQAHFDSTKFTNYTSQEFQQLSHKTSASSPSSSQGSSPPSLLATNAKLNAGNDVYNQARLISETLKSGVKSFLEATNAPGQKSGTPAIPSPSAPPSPSLSVQRTSGSAPSPASPSVSSPTRSPTSTATKRKASTDVNAPPSKVQALTPAQQEFHKEAQLFSSKDIRSGMHRLNSLMSNANLLDIYNKFHRADEYSQYHTKSHPPPSSTSSTTAQSV